MIGIITAVVLVLGLCIYLLFYKQKNLRKPIDHFEEMRDRLVFKKRETITEEEPQEEEEYEEYCEDNSDNILGNIIVGIIVCVMTIVFVLTPLMDMVNVVAEESPNTTGSFVAGHLISFLPTLVVVGILFSLLSMRGAGE